MSRIENGFKAQRSTERGEPQPTGNPSGLTAELSKFGLHLMLSESFEAGELIQKAVTELKHCIKPEKAYEITKEMKAACMGEFWVEFDGRATMIDWPTIKDIYRKMLRVNQE